MKNLILISLMVFVISCSNPVKRNNADKSIQNFAVPISESTEQKEDFGYLKLIGDSLEIPFFEIELKLSEKAEEKLKTDNESVIVVAFFEGIIKDENIPNKYQEKVDFGRILNLLSFRIELTDERLARFENIKFHKELYDLLEDKDITILINVFIGRKSTNMNFLKCDILHDYMSNVKEKRLTIYGKLIEE